MSNTYEGSLIGTELAIGIVVARFNESITSKLLHGALGTLKQHGVGEENIDIAWVPGAFEIPLASKKMAEAHYDAIITLGAVIRGATPHFDYVCNEAASGIMNVSLETDKSVIFGVLTTDTLEQAMERSGTRAGNKGAEAAMAALEMGNLITKIES